MEAPHPGALDRGDPESLGPYLRALGLPNRLELLRQLGVPRTVHEIRLTPTRADRERRPDRILSRRAVEKHLAALEALGLVTARAGRREGQPVLEYVLNAARVFLVLDGLRRLTFRTGTGVEATQSGGAALGGAPPRLPPGRALVLVNGPLDGLAFPLEGRGPWTIGRARGLDVALPYDPFVSLEHARLALADGRLGVEPLASARNTTSLNWEPLPRGRAAPVAGGDVIGVGRSLLLVRAG